MFWINPFMLAPKLDDPLYDHLISYYRQDGNALDEKGVNNGANSEVNEEETVSYVEGINDGAAHYNGVDAYTDLGSIVQGRTEFSITTLIKKGTNGGIIYGLWGSPNVILLRESAGNLQFYLYTSSGQVGGTFFSGFTNTTNYYHIAATYDGAKMKMFLDAVESGTALNQTGALNSGGSEKICNERANFGNYTIDGLGVWDKALTSAEVIKIRDRQLLEELI